MDPPKTTWYNMKFTTSCSLEMDTNDMDIIASNNNPPTGMGPQVSHFWTANKADILFSFFSINMEKINEHPNIIRHLMKEREIKKYNYYKIYDMIKKR